MARNTYLSTIESKKKINKQNRNRIIETENVLTVAKSKRGCGDRQKR